LKKAGQGQQPVENVPAGQRGRQREAAWTRPALRRIIQKMLLPHIRAGGMVLEVGAGNGELSVLTDGAMPPGARWMATDQLVQSPGQTIATLPDLTEVSDEVADVIAELSVADAVTQPILAGSFAGMWRVLKPGGVIIRIMDLREQSAILGPDAARQGLLPLLYVNDAADNREFSKQLVLIDRDRLREQMPAIRQAMLSPAGAEKIESWLTVPDGVLSNEDPPGQRNNLLAMFRRLKIVAAEVDLAAYAQNRLMDALVEANRTLGTEFHVEFCGPVTEETVVKRATLVGLPKKVAAIASRYGLVRIWEKDPFGPHSDTFVRVRSTAIILVGRKMEVTTEKSPAPGQ
jgi:hypothetical protein